MVMPSKPLIIVVISFLFVAFIYSSSSSFNVYAVLPDKRWGTSSSNCSTDDKTGQRTCCWREPVPGQILGKTYCQTCDRQGKVCKEKVLQFVSPSKLGDSVLPDIGIIEQPPTALRGNNANIPLEEGSLEQQEQPSKQGGLLGLLEEATPPSDQSRFLTKGGLLGLLNEESNSLQPSLPEITIPQQNIPSTDLLSNLDDNNLLTSVPPEQTERLNLLEERDKESTIIETDTDYDENILKEEDDVQEQEQTEEQLSLNQEHNEIQSEEEARQEENEQELLKQTSKKQKKVIEGLKDIEDTQSQSQFEIQEPTADLK